MIKKLIPFWTFIEREIFRTKRVLGQALIAPMVTASLYIFVFGFVLGSSIKEISGIDYLTFVFPGIFTMNLILAVFGSTSFNIMIMKFGRTFEDYLTLPMSYIELIFGMLTSAVIRAVCITLALSLVAFIFGVNTLLHPFILLFYVIFIAILFGVLGIVVGVWADNSFEKMGLANNFILTPLSFLGGTFYSLSMLPESLRFIVYMNPIFYCIDGIRYAFTGYHEANIYLGLSILGSLCALAILGTVYIFKTGWKLRS
jgi:ABC-2 type transport system permease protein